MRLPALERLSLSFVDADDAPASLLPRREWEWERECEWEECLDECLDTLLPPLLLSPVRERRDDGEDPALLMLSLGATVSLSDSPPPPRPSRSASAAAAARPSTLPSRLGAFSALPPLGRTVEALEPPVLDRREDDAPLSA